jgi:hypothetical protein
MTFEHTKLPQEEDLPPDNTHGTKFSAMQLYFTGRVYYLVFE